MFFSKAILVVVVSIVASSVIATPHALSHALHHRAIAARVVSPPPNNLTTTPSFRKRQNTQRCRQRHTSSSSLPKPSPSSSTSHTTTPQQAPPVFTPKPSSSSTSVHQPAPSTTSQPSSGNLPNFLVGTQTGQGTFYSTGLGACGITNNDNDFIVAVSQLMFDKFPGYNKINPNTNPVCNKKIKATYQGKSVTVTVTDRCTGCAIVDLDFSPAAFNDLADFAVGRIDGMTWVWL